MKIKKKIIILLTAVLVLCLSFLVSCDYGSKYDPQSLDSAESMFIGQTTTRSKKTTSDGLSIITNNHTITNFRVWDGECTPEHWDGVEEIIDLNNGYLLLKYKYNKKYFYAVKLLSLETGKAVCVNHDWTYGLSTAHLSMDCNLEKKFFSVSKKDPDNIFWSTGHYSKRLLDGTKIVKYSIETRKQKELAYTVDLRLHAIAVDSNENILVYPTIAGFGKDNGTGHADSNVSYDKTVVPGMYIKSDESIIKFNYPAQTYFGFTTPNDTFYVTDENEMKKVELINNEIKFTSIPDTADSWACNDCVTGDDFVVLYKENDGILYVISNNGSVNKPNLGFSSIKCVFAYKDSYYIAGTDVNSNQILKKVTNGTETLLNITSDINIESMYVTDEGVVISGKDSSQNPILISLEGTESKIISNSLTEVKNLSKID